MCALTILGLSTFSAWYEGSEIRDDPWEWEHSAIFSKIMNGEISSKVDISQLDHFIYAAKFKPFFPILILLSLTYMVMISVFAILKHNTRRLIVGYISIGTLSFLTASAVLILQQTAAGFSLHSLLLSVY
ncbi:DUF4306 domain-containing protein [Alkalihalobacillus sp. TS-13]|uniref:DUF4306 domain-containing protein n=1 Tax=Alkalihalobacillus sp. TS-13 TaxID=2842455 RepID=UPI001C88A52C